MRTLFVDTNIILRFLLRDHQGMYEAAAHVFEQAELGEFTLFIEPLVIAECIYVLKGPLYRREKSDVSQALIEILLLDGVQCEDTDRLTECLSLFSERNVDFTDAYLACRSRGENEGVVSFDRDFVRLGGALHIPDYENQNN